MESVKSTIPTLTVINRMHPLRAKRLSIILALLLAFTAVVGLVLYALKQNINLYYIPSELAEAHLPMHTTFRLGGLVKKGSIKKENGRLQIRFVVTDNKKEQAVIYQGVLPDLFREGQGVIVEGRLNDAGVMEGKMVLAKHDENYHPPKVTMGSASTSL